MGALSAMNDSFRFMQKRFTDLALPALEGYLIMLVAQVVMVPVIIIMIFPALIIPFTSSSGAIIILAVVIVLLYFVAFGAAIFSQAVMMGGMVRAIDDIRNHRKIEFGDMFRYGWKHKWELFRIQLLNTFLVSLVTLGLVGMVVGIGIIILLNNALAGFIFLTLMMVPILPITYALMPLRYLPHVIRYKRGVQGTANVSLAWKEYFSDPVTYGLIGFMYMILLLIFMFIPFLNIIVALALNPAFFSTLLIYYDEKYRIPVMPEPPAYPLYPPYPPSPDYYQSPPPNYHPEQFSDRYWR